MTPTFNIVEVKNSWRVCKTLYVYADGTLAQELVGSGYSDMDRAKQEANRMEYMDESESHKAD